ncbi:hypothetical protein F5Y15DRAFT_389781 [Xylariaceae sp. FL0016]|nr:hypothetical protein F5Y15DRAFT_389781 [Xylariaceae sp. FL0016]
MELQAVFNHLVLPPKVPGAADKEPGAVGREILTRLIRASENLENIANENLAKAYTNLSASLRACQVLNIDGGLDKATILEHFRQLEADNMMIIHVAEQNAGLLIYRVQENDQHYVLFESFEASPLAEKVLAAPDALQWEFPGRSVQLPSARFQDAQFRDNLATFLSQASLEAIHYLQAQTCKAGVSVIETRDTTDPALITQMLMSLLEAVGSYTRPYTMCKRIRDEVNMEKIGIPWRRLPLWLILRVATQRHLSLFLGHKLGRMSYKALLAGLFGDLLETVMRDLDQNSTINLRTKLTRRMSKLEIEISRLEAKYPEECESLVSHLHPVIEKIVNRATAEVESTFKSFKKETTKLIPQLHRHASPADLHLTLTGSYAYLESLSSHRVVNKSKLASLSLPKHLDSAIEQSQKFMNRIARLSSLEAQAEDSQYQSAHSCVTTAAQIDLILNEMDTTYEGNPEQMSILVLYIFSLWSKLDMCINDAYPLLRDHKPAFDPELLDVLQLPTLNQMRSLQKIQTHLHGRRTFAKLGTIFMEPQPNCFALRFYSALDSKHELRELESRIQGSSQKARNKKQAEWDRVTDEYDRLTEAINTRSCLCRRDADGNLDIRGCKRCWHWRCRKKLNINIHEDFLPKYRPAKAALIVELAMPEEIAVYRDVTWRVLKTLAYPSRPTKAENPGAQITDWQNLLRLVRTTGKKRIDFRSVTLASRKKPFTRTHYNKNFNQGKVPLSKVLLPFAAEVELYDSQEGIWIVDLTEPLTLQHLCGITIPKSLHCIVDTTAPHPPPIMNDITSYMIQASQNQCPPDMSVHEFSALGRLLGGTFRRWPDILVELTSLNLNFSNEETSRMLCQLVTQAGPQSARQTLRDVHLVFREDLFLDRLEQTVQNYLQANKTNWREHNGMEFFITLSLRLFSLTSDSSRQRGEALLEMARRVSLDWTYRVRQEVRTAQDADVGRRMAGYGFHAALLCRMTFAIYSEDARHISEEDLSLWVQASLALQENLILDLDKLGATHKRMMIRDAKMSHRIHKKLQNAIQQIPEILSLGIAKTWSSDPEKFAASFSVWDLVAQHDHWVVATKSNPQGRAQVVHFEYMLGHLLVDHQPRGKLPLEITNNDAVKKLFGNKHLLAYPSWINGMSHQLAMPEHGNEVHFGLRDGSVVIRAFTRGTNHMLELIPPNRFVGWDGRPDFPSELLDNCVHWLNLTTKELEIRRMPSIWNRRPSDWTVNVPERKAIRRNVQLVDPRSNTSRMIVNIFSDFEHQDCITVYQSEKGLHADLRRMGLAFTVNTKRLLECRQLKAEIDPDQDAGTWYGLRSKLVLRDATTQQRILLVPFGAATFRLIQKQNAAYHEIRLEPTLDYGKYVIDEILGRLSCAPEPQLVYHKAFLHAVTSLCLADPLTGRTGTEEAFSILQSGTAQPWVGRQAPAPALRQFEALIPCREYYPPDVKRIQRVKWSSHMSSTVQHDGFAIRVRELWKRHYELGQFTHLDDHSSLPTVSHLQYRGDSRRRLYDRPLEDTIEQSMQDHAYASRDHSIGPQGDNVYQVSRLIETRCSSLHTSRTLRDILRSYGTIGGFRTVDHSLYQHRALLDQIETPVSSIWGDLISFCTGLKDWAPLMFRFGLLAFQRNVSVDAIGTIIAFAFIQDLKELQPPTFESFSDYPDCGPPEMELLQAHIAQAYIPLKPKPSTTRRRTKATSQIEEAEFHRESCDKAAEELARHLIVQWPIAAEDLLLGDLVNRWTPFIDISMAIDNVAPLWKLRWANLQLNEFVVNIQKVIDSIQGPRDTKSQLAWTPRHKALIVRKCDETIPLISNVLPKISCQALEGPSRTFSFETDEETKSIAQSTARKKDPPIEFDKLERILKAFVKSPGISRQTYGDDLLQSLTALKKTSGYEISEDREIDPEVLQYALDQEWFVMSQLFEQISEIIASGDRRSKWLRLGAIWPCATTTDMLRLLKASSVHGYGEGLKEALTMFGISITLLQRLQRMKFAIVRNDHRILAEELRNRGHTNWSPIDESDWLLLEIDGNFMFRAEQVDVARAIINPDSKRNSVLQMNMGKGKTSCILPMVITSLANGIELVRLIVPKALLKPTAQIVQSRLGGLVGREIYHMPFSRKTSTSPDLLDLYAKIHHSAQSSRSVILTCHEHILSYKLGGWQSLADGKTNSAKSMLQFQDWLNENCRDVLDESDFTLSVKTQLNYPSGAETPIDGHPFRWHVSQGLLALAESHLPTLQKKFSSSIDITEREGSFPLVHFLKSDVEEALHHLIINSICSGNATFLDTAKSVSHDQVETVRRFLTEKNFSQSLWKRSVELFPGSKSAAKVLLVVRGLLANRIILLCLGKRWNVQYGLHPNRHPVAVPYDAKGIPSEQAEFGHPDVAIIFTCLSFYYAGLSYTQFIQGLQHVLQTDDPASQYELWTSECNSLPEALRHWNAINIDDADQMRELWQQTRAARIVVNHYMNHFVFPAHARQFETKLQASAWDLPLFLDEERQQARTTGFSGTNDNRAMLPLTICQDDLPSQHHTSAEVLSYLLQNRQGDYKVTKNRMGQRWNEKDLLVEVQRQGIRVLIDAGAFILEMDNRTLASEWLKCDTKAKAAVYFSNDGAAWVHHREKQDDTPLIATPFVSDLSDCVVYLDQVHTRGVDMQFPGKAKGALTLALKQTKDFTVQAAMRLRLLRTSQSISFFAPPEVDQSIRALCKVQETVSPTSSDVVTWLLEQTCQVNGDLRGLYAAQGADFCRRTDIVWHNRDIWSNKSSQKRVLELLRQPESQTLEQLYGETPIDSVSTSLSRISNTRLQSFLENLRGQASSGNGVVGALEEVEQEREVQVQVEQVRQVQKRVTYTPHTFPGLHPNIESFAATGFLEEKPPERIGIEQTFTFIANTALGSRFGVRETASRFYLSEEFSKTIQAKHDKNIADNFIRPVEWILWSPSRQTALVVIPEEVELLIPMLRHAGSRSPTFLIRYSAPITKAMLSFNQLDYYTLPQLPADHVFPQWLRFELGILAGRLYVEASEWDSLSSYIRPSSVQVNESTSSSEYSAKFCEDPASFLTEWLTLRRKNQDILQTPMGYICTGRSVNANHPFRGLTAWQKVARI